MGSQERNHPLFFRFHPTEQELIYLLKLKAGGFEISSVTDGVLENRLFGNGMEASPWNVFSDEGCNERWERYDVYDDDDVDFDFGKRGNDHAKWVIYVASEKKSRTAGCGNWKEQRKPRAIWDYEAKEVIGFVKSLSYEVEHGYEWEASDKGFWCMHEYSLSEDSLQELGIEFTDFVICRIIWDGSKPCKIKSSVEAIDDIRVADEGILLDFGDHEYGSPQFDGGEGINHYYTPQDCEFGNDFLMNDQEEEAAPIGYYVDGDECMDPLTNVEEHLDQNYNVGENEYEEYLLREVEELLNQSYDVDENECKDQPKEFEDQITVGDEETKANDDPDYYEGWYVIDDQDLGNNGSDPMFETNALLDSDNISRDLLGSR